MPHLVTHLMTRSATHIEPARNPLFRVGCTAICALVMILFSLTGCHSKEAAARQEFLAAVLKEDSGDLDGAIAALEAFLNVYGETSPAQQAREELQELEKIRQSEPAKREETLQKLVAAAALWHKEQRAQPRAADPLTGALAPPLPDFETHVIEESFNVVVGDLRKLALLVHVSCRGFYRRNGRYTPDAALLGVEWDTARYDALVIPFGRTRDGGYQGYTIEVTDKVYRATIIMKQTGEMFLKVREKVFIEALYGMPTVAAK